jgi:hypothetical protein
MTVVETTTEPVLETWESQIRGRQGVIRLLPGGEQDELLIRGGQQFSLTPTERRLTEQANPGKRNPFMNGTFRRLGLKEGDEDYERFASIPSLDADDVDAIFNGPWPRAQKLIAKINEPFTLDRLLEVGEDLAAAAKRLQAIRDQRDKVTPSNGLVNAEPENRDGTPRQRQSYYPDDVPEQPGRKAATGGRARAGAGAGR